MARFHTTNSELLAWNKKFAKCQLFQMSFDSEGTVRIVRYIEFWKVWENAQ